MSTTPTTTNGNSLPYTVVGGEKVDRAMHSPRKLSLVLLNRGGKFSRATLFSELEEIGADEIISIEQSPGSYDVESLARSYTGVRFLLLKSPVTVGEQVNIGMQEAMGKFVLVLWNDMRLSGFSERTMERVAEMNCLCVVGAVRNTRGELMPTIPAPAFYNKQLKVLPIPPQQDGLESLYPYDYSGLYRKERFLSCGGYDPRITTAYWQKMDFGFRSFMWGESIRCATSLKINLQSNPPAEDTTPDESYKRFYLKNLSVVYSGDRAELPFSRFLHFFLRTSGGLIHDYRLFREVQEWVTRNGYLFKQDARRVTDLWEVDA